MPCFRVVANRLCRRIDGTGPWSRGEGDLFQAEPIRLESRSLEKRLRRDREELIEGLFHIARADGKVTPEEVDFLRQVAEIFGFDDGAWARIRAANMGPDHSAPYQILRVARENSDAGIKATHRKLVLENHPDRLVAQGMPQEFIDLANEKLATINAAYDEIRKQRGLA